MDLLARKKQENIADYVISMWHIEDLMRASRFDMSVVEDRLIAPIGPRSAGMCSITRKNT